MSGIPRIKIVDHLRGLAILIVILTHVLSPYRDQSHSLFLFWDLIHFAVPMFVFCASYIFFSRFPTFDKLSPKKYFVSRIKRLLIPYYIFLIGFLTVSSFLNSRLPTAKQIFQNVTLRGGVDINWLVLLFLQLTVVMVLILYLQSKPVLFKIFSFITIMSTFVFIFVRPGYGAKHLHWISWSVIVIFTYLFVKNGAPVKFMKRTFIVSASLFSLLFFMRPILGFSAGLFDNKYPPNAYYLSYGLMMLSLCFFLLPKFVNQFLEKVLHFLSCNAYQLYFAHYIILYVASSYKLYSLPWYLLFTLVFFASWLLVALINVIQMSIFKPAVKT